MLEASLIMSSLILFSILVYVIFRNNIVVRRKSENRYSIHFKHVGKPIDLRQNGRLMEEIDIISDDIEKGIYSVQSYLSDIKLKELLMKEYQLTLNQVIVQSQQLSGPLGAI